MTLAGWVLFALLLGYWDFPVLGPVIILVVVDVVQSILMERWR